MFTLTNINNEVGSYAQLAALFEANRNKQFEQITLQLKGWFAANMAAALGGILDKLAENVNQISVPLMETEVRNILMRNGFLAYFGGMAKPDAFH